MGAALIVDGGAVTMAAEAAIAKVSAGSGSTFASSLRERMSSFANTLRRCHSTVRALRNRRAPISGFVRPSPASRAIWASLVPAP